LLIELDQTQTIWTSPRSVVSSTPSFCRFIPSYPGRTTKSLLTDSFGQLLGVVPWSAESHLRSELCGFVYEFQGQGSGEVDWNAVCKYLFSAIRSIPQKYYGENVRSCEGWMREILSLPIFPVRSPGRTPSLRGLQDGSIFVPNSPALNSELGDKVDLLDFVGQDIYLLVPFVEFVQRHMSSSMQLLSTFDTEDYIQIQGEATVCIEAEERLALRKKYIARYTDKVGRRLSSRLLYSCNTRGFADFGAFQARWNGLEVQEVKAITQPIIIPEVRLEHMRKRFFLLRCATNDKTVIYLAKSAQAIDFLSLYLGLALGCYFEIPELGSKIDKILSSPLHMISDLLAVHWGIRELPPDWLRQLQAEGGQDHVSQDTEESAVSPSSQLTLQTGNLFQYRAPSSPQPSRGINSASFRRTTRANTGNVPSIPRPNFEHESESDWSDDQNILTPSRPTSEIIREGIATLKDIFDNMTDEQRRQRRRTAPSASFSAPVREAAVSLEQEIPPPTRYGPAVSRISLYRTHAIDQGVDGRQGIEDGEDGEEVATGREHYESHSRRFRTSIHDSPEIIDEARFNSSHSSQDGVLLHPSDTRIMSASPFHAPATHFPIKHAGQTQRRKMNVFKGSAAIRNISGALGESFVRPAIITSVLTSDLF